MSWKNFILTNLTTTKRKCFLFIYKMLRSVKKNVKKKKLLKYICAEFLEI